VIARALLLAAALAAAAWFGLGLHSARLESRASAIAQVPPQLLAEAQVHTALADFQGARANNPDTRPIVLEAGLLARRGRGQEAIALLLPVVQREPENLTAWVLISLAAQPGSALAERAAARARALNPPVAPAR
jgi:predicted Zn-dependent protease